MIGIAIISSLSKFLLLVKLETDTNSPDINPDSLSLTFSSTVCNVLRGSLLYFVPTFCTFDVRIKFTYQNVSKFAFKPFYERMRDRARAISLSFLAEPAPFKHLEGFGQREN